MKIKNLMSGFNKVSSSKSFFGISVLMFVAFMSFSTTVNAQYVSTPAAIQILKEEALTNGSFKQTGTPIGAKIQATITPIDYAKMFRVQYVNELLDLVILYGNVAIAIDANHANWTQRLSNSNGRSLSTPVLKAYVINLLKA